MNAVERPDSEAALAAAIAAAATTNTPFEIRGGGTKNGLGRPVQAAAVLETGGLRGITLYEPAELVISARAGTPLKDIVAALDENGQHLAFEPMDCGPLFESDGERATIGAVAACNLSGPRRILAGAARDALIGVRLVNGLGDVVKSGGRVMKNVTGYDLVKLVAGAHGSLGVLTEVTFKVLPKPEAERTLVFTDLTDEDGRAAMSMALGSPFEVNGAAHMPSTVAGGESRTLIRIEGFPESLDYRAGALRRDLKRFRIPDILTGVESAAIWRDIRDARPILLPADRAIWRVSTAPTRGPAVAAEIAARLDTRYFFDLGGGLIWLSLPQRGDAGASVVREAVGGRGHATLVRAPADIRSAVAVFEPQNETLMRLTAGVKASFDPAGILNPGRMYAGL